MLEINKFSGLRRLIKIIQHWDQMMGSKTQRIDQKDCSHKKSLNFERVFFFKWYS